MISYKDRKAVRELARDYGMPESYIRQMLAIEGGVIKGDIKEVPTARPRGGRIRPILLFIVTLGMSSFFRPSR